MNRPRRALHLILVGLLAAGGLVAGGCSSPDLLTRPTVDDTFVEIRAKSLAAFEATSDRPVYSVQKLMVELRRVLANMPSDESAVLFDSLPQGLRSISGVPRDERRFLRDGVLTSHAYVRDALIDDYSYEGLERYVRELDRLTIRRRGDDAIDSAPFTGPGSEDVASEAEVNPEEVAIWHRYEPAGLYRGIVEIMRDPEVEYPITIVSMFLPYESGTGRERGTSFSFYVANGNQVLGFDVLDTEGLAHESIASNSPSGLAAPFHAGSRGFSWLVDHTLQLPIPGTDEPIAFPLNFVCNVAAQAVIAAKETAFEIVKAPLAGLGSLISEDRGLDRMTQSTLQPLRNVGDVWGYHADQVGDRLGRPSVFQSFVELLGATPFLGGYRPVYFDDPWTQYAESPPNGGPSGVRDDVAAETGKEHLHLFLTRGIHGRDAEEQGNEAWRRFMVSLVAEDADLRASYGVEPDADLSVTVDAIPYPWGTAWDPVFSMMNLSSGYSYAMERGAEEIIDQYPDEKKPVVALLGHSGGVQRMTVASRLMWYRGIATESLYGVAGPSISHAPTKPGQNITILSKSEFQDADLTSQFSAGVATLESSFLTLYELPVIGFL